MVQLSGGTLAARALVSPLRGGVMSHVINGTPGASAVARKAVKAHRIEASQMLVCEAVHWNTRNPKATMVAIAVYATGAEPVAEEYAEHLKQQGANSSNLQVLVSTIVKDSANASGEKQLVVVGRNTGSSLKYAEKLQNSSTTMFTTHSCGSCCSIPLVSWVVGYQSQRDWSFY